jgi:hypothetical protein
MNLHNVRVAMRNVAMWVVVTGANGRHIGHHLYPLAEGVPPEGLGTRQSWQDRAWWRPARYGWRPFEGAAAGLFRNGYVAPLCGHRSASTRPRASLSRHRGVCVDCVRIATQRGMMALTYDEAQQMSTTLTALQTEQAAWVAAGRPDQWP